jgi:hypothetical protein
MRRVFRLVSALGAGAALVWGLAKSLRRRNKDDDASTPSEGTTTDWPPRPESPVDAAPADAAPVEEAPEDDASEEEAPAEEPPVEEAPAEPVDDAPEDAPEELVLKGVVIDDPAAFLAFANDATEAQLEEAGIKGRPQSVLMEARPYDSVEAIGATKGVGRRTLQSLNAALG